MPKMPKSRNAHSLTWATAVACLAVCCAASATEAPSPRILSTSAIHVSLRDDPQAPRLEWIEGSHGNHWSNQAAEPLPASVEINGATVPVTWQLRPSLGPADTAKIVFVYESATPHLRLSWIWEARAASGPVEHRIQVENLSNQELWLPMVDSLRLNWRINPPSDLRNLYIEKGADTPSAAGTHLETIAENYSWTGKSSTYAHPTPGRSPRNHPRGDRLRRRLPVRLVRRHRVQRTHPHLPRAHRQQPHHRPRPQSRPRPVQNPPRSRRDL